MCPDCLNAHEVLKTPFEGHKVISVKEFKAENYEALLRRQPFCSQQFHEKEIMSFFCVECQSCVCHICIVVDHRNHGVDVLDKAAQDEKHNIITGTESIKEKIKKLNADIRQLEETTSVMERNVTKAKRKVMEAAEQMITKIRAHEREVITSIETTHAKRLERINSPKQDILSLLKQLNKAVDFADNIMKRSSSTVVMQNKGTLEQRFEEFHVIHREVPKHYDIVMLKLLRLLSRAQYSDLLKGRCEEINAARNRSTFKGWCRSILLIVPQNIFWPLPDNSFPLITICLECLGAAASSFLSLPANALSLECNEIRLTPPLLKGNGNYCHVGRLIGLVVRHTPEGTYPRGIRDAFRHLVKEEGVASLFKGVTPVLLRAFPANAGLFLGYEVAMKTFSWILPE
ncbi:Mitochondrial carnitine/acylcarnitine carrier protein [Stylophora pistillata]|uniref:Mitochondrial carnitine/acylcarnitine carrier protein n=1 Tax=Stylophora pistillata TaxID=50429 RepID=A0A2B4S0D1_STYPI|nr:Mitochondrial carnitine/acylcarnitine carrier protein [Stylophora pistillata]